MNFKSWSVFCLALGLSAGVMAEEAEQSIYNGSLDNRVKALSAIQPGLGVVMHEIGRRMVSAHQAANGENWGLAQYELKELLEAQEVAELTRPNRAEMLKAFEKTYLDPLGESIEKKDLKQFNQRFSDAVTGCNACHTALGHSFIKFQLPMGQGRSMLDVNVKTEPSYEEGD